MIGLCMLYATCLASATPNAQEAPPGKALVSAGVTTVSVGDYRVTFAEDSAWTLREAWYKERPLLLKTGWQQTVINVQVPNGQEPWIGTGHGKERVESVELCVDGESHPLAERLALSGPAFTLSKHSRLGPYAHVSNVTVDAAGITEAFQYEVVEDASAVRFMYVFMHCFSNDTRDWIACLNDGSEVGGTFLDDNSFSLHEVVRWIAVYEPANEWAALYVYPEPYDANGAKANMFWNRPRDNKLYFQILPEKKLGKMFDYTVRLQAHTAPEADWKTAAKKAAEALARAYARPRTP